MPGGGRVDGDDVRASIGRRGVSIDRARDWEGAETLWIVLEVALNGGDGRAYRCGSVLRMHGRRHVDVLVPVRAMTLRQRKAFIANVRRPNALFLCAWTKLLTAWTLRVADCCSTEVRDELPT